MSASAPSPMPPNDWIRACDQGGSLFHCPAWQGVLQRAFNCSPHYTWDQQQQDGLALTVFRAGPFRIGYVGFPAGGTLMRGAVTTQMIAALKANTGSGGLHLIRIPVSGFGPTTELPFHFSSAPETAITELGRWRPENLPAAVRRNVRSALRQGVRITDNACHTAHDVMYSLYRGTIERRGGAARYNAEYFRQLALCSQQDPRIRCLLAMHGDQIAGFVVILRDGAIYYYLHGAMDPALSVCRAMDLLFHEAIRQARDDGGRCFNMMSSPPGSSLIRFKEKWGGTTVAHRTYAVPVHALYARLFSFGEKLYRLAR